MRVRRMDLNSVAFTFLLDALSLARGYVLPGGAGGSDEVSSAFIILSCCAPMSSIFTPHHLLAFLSSNVNRTSARILR
jgi:hypothetical protein